MSIKLMGSDGQAFRVSLEAAKLSITIRTMLQDLGFTQQEEDEPIPLPNVTGAILEKVIEWSEYHKNDPPFVEDETDERRSDNILEWDKNFLNVDNNILFDLILAANYLDIKGLLDVGCKAVANLFKNKTPEEIRDRFMRMRGRSTEEADNEPTPMNEEACPQPEQDTANQPMLGSE